MINIKWHYNKFAQNIFLRDYLSFFMFFLSIFILLIVLPAHDSKLRLISIENDKITSVIKHNALYHPSTIKKIKIINDDVFEYLIDSSDAYNLSIENIMINKFSIKMTLTGDISKIYLYLVDLESTDLIMKKIVIEQHNLSQHPTIDIELEILNEE